MCDRVCPYDAVFMGDDLEYAVDGAKWPRCRRCLDPWPAGAIVPMDDPRAVALRESNRPVRAPRVAGTTGRSRCRRVEPGDTGTRPTEAQRTGDGP